MTRQRGAIALVAIAFLLHLCAGPVLYAGGVIQEEDRFVAVAEEVIAHPSMRQAVAQEVSELTFLALGADEQLAAVLPDQVRGFAIPITRIATSQLTDAAFALLDTELATGVRESALRELHGQLTADSDDLVIDLRGVVVRTSRELAGPTAGAAVAKLVSDRGEGRYTIAEAGSTEANLAELVRSLPAIGGLIWMVAIAAMLLALLLASERRQMLVIVGLTSAGAAFVSVVIVTVVLVAVLGAMGGGASLERALVDVFVDDYAEQQRGAIVAGLLVAGVGLVLGHRPAAIALRQLPGAMWRRDRAASVRAITAAIGDNPAFSRLITWLGGALLLVSWTEPTGRVVITVAAGVAAIQLIIWTFSSPHHRAASLRRALAVPEPISPLESTGHIRLNSTIGLLALFLFWPAWSLGLVTAFLVAGALLQAALDVRPARRAAKQQAYVGGAEALEAPMPRRRLALATIAVAALVMGGLALVGSADDAIAASSACNGHEELCDRRVNEVVFAGSHNSMSSTDLGWDLAMQTGDIVTQLDQGVRALLIDTHYWDRPGAVEGGDDGAAAAVIEAALADDQPRPGMWLCHGFCALGATEFDTALADLAVWLDANPREVVQIIIQDETSEADVVAAFDSAGLLDHVHFHEPGTPWPTLGELVNSDERLLVFAENNGTPTSWYQNAWANFTETPFDFDVRSDFTCDPNRGDPDNDLYLINHWVTTGIPVREAAASINSRSSLLDRVQECEAATGRLPTVIAVDFVATGDLFEVVDELNGVG